MDNNYLCLDTYNPAVLVKKYGSPLYVYNETILRERCRELKRLVTYENFVVDYSMKANSNPALLKILHEEGIEIDVVSSGEIYVAEMAGYNSNELLFVCNNISEQEMLYAINKNIRISVDSISQLEQFGKLSPHSKVAIRVNTGVGAGHHAKVVTGGKSTKFGISTAMLKEIKEVCKRYDLTILGINQHIGSLFLNGKEFLESIKCLFDFCENFPDLDFIDFGGGFGVPYRQDEQRLDLKFLGHYMDEYIREFVSFYGKNVQIRIEPGRYIVAECGMLLGTVLAKKQNHSITYAGTDLGFNTLMRPVLYDSYHDISVFRQGKPVLAGATETVTIVGNVCESGDILAKDRNLPIIELGDIICVETAGAYGYAMSSNYNSRLRPAEVLLTSSGEDKLIRKRDSYENLIENCIF